MPQSDSPGLHQAAKKFNKAHSIVIFFTWHRLLRRAPASLPSRIASPSLRDCGNVGLCGSATTFTAPFSFSVIRNSIPSKWVFRISQHSLKMFSRVPLSVWCNAGSPLTAALDEVHCLNSTAVPMFLLLMLSPFQKGLTQTAVVRLDKMVFSNLPLCGGLQQPIACLSPCWLRHICHHGRKEENQDAWKKKSFLFVNYSLYRLHSYLLVPSQQRVCRFDPEPFCEESIWTYTPCVSVGSCLQQCSFFTTVQDMHRGCMLVLQLNSPCCSYSL